MSDRAERHVVVPVEPTDEMVMAVEGQLTEARGWNAWSTQAVYRAMIAAAPPVQMEAVALPKYGRLPFDELGRDVNEARMGRRVDFDFGEIFPGHVMVDGFNFNSLNRVVSKYASPVPSPVQMEAVARYGLKSSTISGVHTHWQWTITKPDGSDLCTISATDADGPVDLDTLYANVDLVRDALNAYASPVPSSERDDIIEMCAKVAEHCVRQECCGNFHIVYGESPETGDPVPVAEDCCGSPDVVPMRPDEIASSIRSLKKSQPAQESGEGK